MALWSLRRAYPVGCLDQLVAGCFTHESAEGAGFVGCFVASLVHKFPYVVGGELLPGAGNKCDRCAGVGFPVRVSVTVDAFYCFVGCLYGGEGVE